MHIDWWTLALQAVNFLVLVWLLTRFLYRPVRRIVEQRKALVDQARAEAEKAKTDAEAVRRHYEEEQAKLPQERQEMLKKAHDDLEEDRKKVLGTAKDEADKMIAAAQASIEDERRDAVKSIEGDVAGLAASLAGQILKGSAGGSLNDVFLDRVEAELKSLPAEELKRLSGDLAEEGAKLSVVTVSALTPDEQARWMERLGTSLGATVTPGFLAFAARKAAFASGLRAELAA